MQYPKYPTTLTKSDWDKSKGIIAKIRVGETGVGAAMDKVKAAYDKVGFEKLQKASGNALPNTDKHALDGLTSAQAKEAIKNIDSLVEKVQELEELARNVAGTLISSSTGRGALGMVVYVPDKIGEKKAKDALLNISVSGNNFRDTFRYLLTMLKKK